MHRFIPILACSIFAAAASASDTAPPIGTSSASPAVLDALQQDHPFVQYFRVGERITRVYGPAFGTGQTPEDSAAQFLNRYSRVLGANESDLVAQPWFRAGPSTQQVMPDRANGGHKFTLMYYSQERDGVPVFRAEARLLVRNEPGYPLVLVSSNLRELGDFRVEGAIERSIPSAAVDQALAIEPRVVGFSAPTTVIWAGYDSVESTPRLAVEFVGDNAMIGTDALVQMRFVADATTGEIYYYEDLVNDVDVTGVVSGNATTGFGADACAAEVSTPLPYGRVEISGGATAFADANGVFTIPNPGSGNVTVNSEIRGPFFRVFDQAGPNSTLSQNILPPGPANFLHNAANTNALERAQVNSYIHANRVRDMVLDTNATYPALPGQSEFPVNVNIASTCNAFYDQVAVTINFYQAGGGCANTGFSSVVYHEFGHHLIQVGGSGQGAYGEGMSDCISIMMQDDPNLAIGFQSCASPLRSAVNGIVAPCSTPIHTCGQVLSGAVWGTRNQLVVTEPANYLQILRDLTVNSILLHTGTSIAADITIDFLTLDDDDSDIFNGTPHYSEINAGFTPKNLPAPALSLIGFSFPSGLPTQIDPAGGTVLRFVVSPIAGTPQPGTGQAFLSAGGGPFNAVPVNQVSPNVYDATFPATTCGSVRFYVAAQSTTAVTVTSPPTAPAASYAAVAAYGENTVFTDNFETNTGWTVQDVALTDGSWTRGVPANGNRGDPPTDFDGSGQCFLTDNVAGNSDVDGGTTHLISPTIDLSGGDAIISYARWYSNTQGSAPEADTFVVAVSNNNGGSWTTVETVGPTGPEVDGGWFARSFAVGAFVPPTAQVRVRFSASDLGSGSVVEAAVDAFRVDQLDCTPSGFVNGDANCDGSVDFFDIDAFLLALFDPTAYASQFCGGSTATADVNDDNSVDFFDIDAFLAVLFP